METIPKIHPFNDEQQTAIDIRQCSVLVSAPAGSGKTKIVVSRIMALLEQDGYDIDQLLVLTFTNAAALEMKQRLELQLDISLQQTTDPDKKQHLQNQKRKLPMAYITNFHGFCSLLIKQYGYLIDIPTTFEIISDPRMIMQEIFDQCVEKWLIQPTFQSFMKTYCGGYNWGQLQSLLSQLHHASHNFLDFTVYQEYVKEHIYQPIITTENTAWIFEKEIKNQLEIKAIEGKNALMELRNYCQKNGLSFFYQNPYEKGKQATQPTPFDCYLVFFNTILETLQTKPFAHIVKNGLPPLEKSYRAIWDDDAKIYQKEYTAKKANLTKGYKKVFEDLLYKKEEEFRQTMDLSYQAIDMLYDLLADYEMAYQAYKQKHIVLDFNDLEAYAHRILEPQYHVVEALFHQIKEIIIDEYQDTNDVQEDLIQKIATYNTPTIPCFMVGDMKQSIYKFRGGDPTIFYEKYCTYNKPETKRIDLRYNYRSHKIVLDSINYIFNQIMDIDIGGLDYYYDEYAKLNFDYMRKEKIDYTKSEQQNIQRSKARLHQENRFTTDILLFEKETNNDYTPEEQEAIIVAKKIQELVGKLSLEQPNRIVQYQDIVVLMRNTTNFITFKKVFDRFQIPSQIVLSQGFLQATEIQDSIAVLQAIDNHLDDVAMVSLLGGNYTISHFDPAFIAHLRQDATLCLYDNMIQYIEQKKENYLVVETFINYYHELVAYSKENSVAKTLSKFYQDSDYPLFLSGLANGAQRYANVMLLVEHLEQQDDPLTCIVTKYTEMIKQKISMSPGQVTETTNNTVSFMTIHKSKGLEFPIVFVCQLHTHFNTRDAMQRLLIDKQLGIALTPRKQQNIEQYESVVVEYPNKYRNLIATCQAKENRDEEMRILYVALTRASQKLILTGAVKDFSTLLKWQEGLLYNEDPDMLRKHPKDRVVLYRNIRNASNYLDWIGIAIMRHPSILLQCKEQQFVDVLDALTSETIQKNADTLAIYPTENDTLPATEHAKFHLTLVSTQDITYPYQEPHNTPKKATAYVDFIYPNDTTIVKSMAVTQKIKDGDRAFSNAIFDTPEHTSVAPNERGTIIHQVLEQLPLPTTVDQLEDALNTLYVQYQYSEKQKSVVEKYKPNLTAFLQSEVYQWMCKSKHIYREKVFTWKEPSGQIIHGIFDVVMIDEKQVTIIDYKTDRIVNTIDNASLISLHQEQMDYYKQVMQHIFPEKDVKTLLYYLHNDRYVLF